jgi:hypothetical protein
MRDKLRCLQVWSHLRNTCSLSKSGTSFGAKSLRAEAGFREEFPLFERLQLQSWIKTVEVSGKIW